MPWRNSSNRWRQAAAAIASMSILSAAGGVNDPSP